MPVGGQSEKEEQGDWRYRRWKEVGRKREGSQDEQEPDLEQPRRKHVSRSAERTTISRGPQCISHGHSDITRRDAGIAGPFRKRSGEVTLRRRHTTNVSKMRAAGPGTTGDPMQTATSPQRNEESKPTAREERKPPIEYGGIRAMTSNFALFDYGKPDPSRWQRDETTRIHTNSRALSRTTKDEDDADHTAFPEDEDQSESSMRITSINTERGKVDTPLHNLAPRDKDPTVHERDLRLVRAYGTANGRLAFDAVLKIRLMRALEQIRQPSSRDQYQEAYRCADSALGLTTLALQTAARHQDLGHLSKTAGQAHYYAGLAAYLAGPDGLERALDHLHSSIEYTRDQDVEARSRAEVAISNIMQYQRDPASINADSTDQIGPKATGLWARVRGTFGSIASTFWRSSPYDRGVIPKGDRLNSDMFDGEVSPGQTSSIRSVSAIGSSTNGIGEWRDSIPAALHIPGLGIDLGAGAGLYSSGPPTRSSGSGGDRSIPEVVPVTKRMTVSIVSSSNSRTDGRARPTPQRNKTAPSSFGITPRASVKVSATRSDRSSSVRLSSAMLDATGRSPAPYSETLSGPSSSSRSIVPGQSNGKQLIPVGRLAPLPDTITEQREDTFAAGEHGPIQVVKKFSTTRSIESFEPPSQRPRLPNPQSPHLPRLDLPYEGNVPPDEAHPEHQGPWLVGHYDGQQWVESEADGEPIWREYTDVKVKRFIEEGSSKKDENGDYADDGLRWNKKNPWTVYHPLERSSRDGGKLPSTEEPEDYPQEFCEADVANAKYAEPSAKRDWQVNDFVLPVPGMGPGPADVEGQREEDRAEDEAFGDAGLWQQKVSMAKKVVGPKVNQMVKEFARGTMKVMLEILTVEEMYEYCLDSNQAALKRKVWDVLCDIQALEQKRDRFPPMPPAPRLSKAQLAVTNKPPSASQIPSTPRLAKAKLANVNRSPRSSDANSIPTSTQTRLQVVNASPQDYTPLPRTPPSPSPEGAELAGTIVSPRESRQIASTPRSPKAKLAVVNKPVEDPVALPQLPRYQETPGAPRATHVGKNVSLSWSPGIPLGAISNSVCSSSEPTTPGRPKSMTWRVPSLSDRHELSYRNKSAPTSHLANKNAINSSKSWGPDSPPFTDLGTSSATPYSPTISTLSTGHRHRRKSSIIQDTLQTLTGVEPGILAEDAAERGETPSASLAVDGEEPTESQKEWRHNRLSFQVVKQYKKLEEVLEEEHSPGVAPERFRVDKRVTF